MALRNIDAIKARRTQKRNWALCELQPSRNSQIRPALISK
jgi:hypothetical protein